MFPQLPFFHYSDKSFRTIKKERYNSFEVTLIQRKILWNINDSEKHKGYFETGGFQRYCFLLLKNLQTFVVFYKPT